MKVRKKKKNPWFAALLNFFFYGAGYVYAGRRRVLGFGLILVFVVMSVEFFLGSVSHVQDLVNAHVFSMTLLGFVLAYDGYVIVKGVK